MDCARFKEDLAEYILSDPCLSEADRQEMQSHMTVCPGCGEVHDGTKWIIGVIRENKDRVREIIRRKGQEEENETRDQMTDKEFAEALANIEPVVEPSEVVEAGWRRLKARFEEMDEEKRRQRTKRAVLFRRAAAIAASVLLLFGLGYAAAKRVLPPAPAMLVSETGAHRIAFGKEIRTNINERKTFRLGDKHTVIANTDTAFTVNPLHAGLKTGYLLTLKSGELYLEVTHDGNPFAVRTADGEAVITGTKFDIRAQSGRTDLTLVEGSVQFSGAGESVTVKTGQLSTVAAGSPPSAPKATDSLAATAWVRAMNVKDALAHCGILSDDAMIRSLLDNWKSPDLPDPSTLDYVTWRDAQRQWFVAQFPWIFRAQAALRPECGVEADYIELLMLSGDIWQFHYPRPFAQSIPVFDPAAVERLAKHYGVSPENLLLAAKPSDWAPATQMELNLGRGVATAQQYQEAMRKWESDISAAEETGGKPLQSDLLLFSIGACRYLASTRTAAYLWVRAHREQAAKTSTCPICAPIMAARCPASERCSDEELMTRLREQAVCAEKVENLAMEQLMNPVKPQENRGRCGCRQSEAGGWADLLAPLAK